MIANDVSLEGELDDAWLQLLNDARDLKKWPIAKLISLFESNTQESQIDRHRVMSFIHEHPQQFKRNGFIVGITGAPGVGKSSLIGELCLQMVADKPTSSIAVLAIDPSSQASGGALLGDRTRSLFPADENRLFFRSQASALDLGGLSRQTFQVTRILQHLFDIIVIETVGVGQNEIEVQQLCDHTCLVMQPLAGDQVQFIKAGIMEIPDTFVINKCDEKQLAEQSCHLLEASLNLTRQNSQSGKKTPAQVFMTSVVTGTGIKGLATCLRELGTTRKSHGDEGKRDRRIKESHFLLKWVRQAYGDYGCRVFNERFLPEITNTMTYEQQQQAFMQVIEPMLSPL